MANIFLYVFTFTLGIAKICCASTLERNSSVFQTIDPEPQNGNGYMSLHESFLDKIRDTKGDIPIIFWGDSLSEQWNGPGKAVFEEKYVPLNVANFGIGGDTTQTLLWRLLHGEASTSLKTKVVVLRIGGNNAKDLVTPEMIFRGVKANVDIIREKLPNAKILLLGMLPGKDYLVAGAVLKMVNVRLASLHNGDTIQYLDLYDKYLNEDGTVNWDLYNTGDKIHLVEAGYRVWSEGMDPLLYKMMGYSGSNALSQTLFGGLSMAVVAALISYFASY